MPTLIAPSFSNQTAINRGSRNYLSVFKGYKNIWQKYSIIKHGALYNGLAVMDPRGLASLGWHIPTNDEYVTFKNFVNNDSRSLRDTSNSYWDYYANMWSPSEGWIPQAWNNNLKFNARASGTRWFDETNGVQGYQHKAMHFHFWLSTPDAYGWNLAELYYLYTPFYGWNPPMNNLGASVRPIKDSTTLTHGQTGTYVGNDGRIYRTICIGTQEWLADNLAETKYRDNSVISLVPVFTDWVALSTGARCFYNNDPSNQ